MAAARGTYRQRTRLLRATRTNWYLLLVVASTRAGANQVDSDLLHLSSEYFALFDSPGEPVAVLILLISRPLCFAYSDEERLIGPRLADPLDQSERPVYAVFQTLTAVLVCPINNNIIKCGEE